MARHHVVGVTVRASETDQEVARLVQNTLDLETEDGDCEFVSMSVGPDRLLGQPRLLLMVFRSIDRAG